MVENMSTLRNLLRTRVDDLTAMMAKLQSAQRQCAEDLVEWSGASDGRLQLLETMMAAQRQALDELGQPLSQQVSTLEAKKSTMARELERVKAEYNALFDRYYNMSKRLPFPLPNEQHYMFSTKDRSQQQQQLQQQQQRQQLPLSSSPSSSPSRQQALRTPSSSGPRASRLVGGGVSAWHSLGTNSALESAPLPLPNIAVPFSPIAPRRPITTSRRRPED
jgi:uncharacterized coiled-coil protein SlyX